MPFQSISSMFNTDSSFDFDVLRNLHDSVNDLLQSPTTKLEIRSKGHEGWANEVSEASLRMADSCAAAKDLLVSAKAHLQHLHSTFRRGSAASEAAATDCSSGNQFAPCRLPRKLLKKAILKRMQSLKGIRNEFFFETPPEDADLAAVVNLLREVRSALVSVVQTLSGLISTPSTAPAGKASPVEAFKLRLKRVDSLVLWGKYGAAEMRWAVKRLEGVEAVVEDLEAELEQMVRRLIRTRALLLNVMSSH